MDVTAVKSAPRRSWRAALKHVEGDGARRYRMEWDSRGRRHVHVFEEADVAAVDTALAARRPLLLLGEPGTGKTQIAAAVAAAFDAPFVSWTLDARTEPGDLLFTVDHIKRLANAQVAGALHAIGSDDANIARSKIEHAMKLDRYVVPGPLWWALDWKGALATEANERERIERFEAFGRTRRVVALIDEIDKAEPDVPNGLLEVLGSNSFRGPVATVARNPNEQEAPLVFITSNDERDLPDAFLRRCVVHVLRLPDDFVAGMARRGRAHFPSMPDELLVAAAELLHADRAALHEGARPGLAEYIDLLRVLDAMPADASESPADHTQRRRRAINVIGRFTFKKFSEIAAERARRER